MTTQAGKPRGSQGPGSDRYPDRRTDGVETRRLAPRVVNLCFHGIGVPGRALEVDEEQYWVDVDQFHDMLAAIARYRSSLRITFDDGNASDVSVALPALLRAGVPASFFVVAGRLGAAGSLSHENVAELAAAGMVVGSHGMWHRPWRSLDEAALREELLDAAEVIGKAAGRRVEEAACPFGAYDRRVLGALRNRGFSRVYTVDGGSTRSDRWLQPRYTVLQGDTAETIERLGRDPHDRISAAAMRAVKGSIKRWR
jgi:peptidoglycan/xylan/chitin deacetylase (PgdA/CDA1 family)